MTDIIILLMLVLLALGLTIFSKGVHDDETSLIISGAMIIVLCVTVMILTAYTVIEV